MQMSLDVAIFVSYSACQIIMICGGVRVDDIVGGFALSCTAVDKTVASLKRTVNWGKWRHKNSFSLVRTPNRCPVWVWRTTLAP